MAEEKDLPQEEETPKAADSAEAAGETEESANDPAAQEAASEAGEGDDAAAQVADLKDQLLRAMAETENIRRRSQREREDLQRYAAVPFLRDVLGVVDNLERALASVNSDEMETNEGLKALFTGVQLTEREFQNLLERHKVERLDPTGQAFDPHQHEAMFEAPDPSQPAGTVIQVIQCGYKLHDRLLRPARVGVSKGGAAAGTTPPGPGSQVDTEA